MLQALFALIRKGFAQALVGAVDDAGQILQQRFEDQTKDLDLDPVTVEPKITTNGSPKRLAKKAK